MSTTDHPAQLFDNFIDPWGDQETIAFTGCVHKIDDAFLWLLQRVANNPTDFLVIGGDIFGSEEFEHLKMLFYCLFNPAHNELLLGTNDPKTDKPSEILSFEGARGRFSGQTLAQAYIELAAYVFILGGYDESTAQKMANTQTNAEIVSQIKHIATLKYYGYWHRVLPLDVRQATNAGIMVEAKRLGEALGRIQSYGTKIIIIGGNWDDQASNQENWGEGIAIIDTKPYFRQLGIAFHDLIAWTVTKKTLLASLPYWELARENVGYEERLVQLLDAARNARADGKTIIGIGHGEPNYEVHFLNSPIPTQEARLTAIRKLGEILFVLKPDEFVHPHQHDPFLDKDGKKLPTRTKYKLRPVNNSVELVRPSDELNEQGLITVSYLTLHGFGRINIPLSSNPLLKPVGDREPIQVF